MTSINKSKIITKFLVFLVIFIISNILGVIGIISFPIMSYMTYFWPLGTLQAIAGLYFGIEGIVATWLAAMTSYLLIGGSFIYCLALSPGNLLESLIPYIILKMFKFSPYKIDKKSILYYIFGCVIIGEVVGAILSSSILFLTNLTTRGGALQVFKLWIIGDMPYAVIFGILILKFLGPALQDSGLDKK